MKVILISSLGSRFRYVSSGILPPLGLAYIASALEASGYEVEIIDLAASNISSKRLEWLVSQNDPLFYGLSSTLFGLKETAQLAKLIKRCTPNSKVVLGGLGTVFSPDIILKRVPEIDIVVKGEGEYAAVELCRALEGKKNLQDIKGISFRDNGRIISNSPRPWIDNLDDNPFPARHLLSNNSYHLHPPYGIYFPIATIETSRGCIANCNFCLYPSRVYRSRSANNIVDEIESVVNTYNVKEIYFADAIFTAEEEKSMKICDEILRRGIKVAWTCKERVDILSRKCLQKMKDAGCYMISYGVESGSQKILDNLNKNITTGQIEEVFRLTKEVGLRSIAYFMVGSPDESKDTVQETIKFISKIEPDFVLCAGLIPDPVSKFYREAVCKGVLSDEYYEKLLFSNDTPEWPICEATSFARKEINGWVKQVNKKFYLRPKYWLKRLIYLKTINEVKNMFKGFLLLVSDMVLPKRNVIG